MIQSGIRNAVFGAGLVASLAVAVPASAQSFTPIDAPVAPQSNVFIEQIGSGNSASVTQSSNVQKAAIRQDGDDNTVGVTQEDAGDHLLVVDQDGDRNSAQVAQSGNGQVIANLSQTGRDNAILLAQRDNGVIGTAAEIVQSGAGNSISLLQDGSDNQARLTQNGDNNAMTASQVNTGNRLEWVQDGSGLSDISVEQTGGQTMFILQTNGG